MQLLALISILLLFFSLSCNQDIIYIFSSPDRFVCDFWGAVHIAKIIKGLLY